MVLTLEPAEEGGYVVTSPLDPELITEAESLDGAFVNARDAAEALNESRRKLAKQLPTGNTILFGDWRRFSLTSPRADCRAASKC
jgi:antitoxin HicB